MSEINIIPEAEVKPINNVAIPIEVLSFKAEDFAADMVRLAAEKGVDIVKAEPIAEPVVTVEPPTQPVQPETATVTVEATKPEVPAKFKAADGSIDEEKLNKSITNVDEALAKYLEKEKELKRKINEVKAKENAYINPTAQTPIPNSPQINQSFAEQLEADIAKEGAGVVLAKLFTAAQEAAEEKVYKEISALKTVNAENTTRQQIEAIGKHDPWVYTPEGMSTLTKILEEQPYLMQAPDPYKAAYIQFTGLRNVVSRPNPQVQTPIPQARPSAPVPTGQAASQVHAPILKLNTQEDIKNHLKKLSVSEQSAFFEKMGFPKF